MKGKHTNSAPLFDPNSCRKIFSYENLTKSRLANILEENKPKKEQHK
jgi:hypothetical protein